MKKIKLLTTALKIEYSWILIKLIRKRRARLNMVLERNENREKVLKYNASQNGKNYEALLGLR